MLFLSQIFLCFISNLSVPSQIWDKSEIWESQKVLNWVFIFTLFEDINDNLVVSLAFQSTICVQVSLTYYMYLVFSPLIFLSWISTWNKNVRFEPNLNHVSVIIETFSESGPVFNILIFAAIHIIFDKLQFLQQYI